MKKNVGREDQIVRILLGGILITNAFDIYPGLPMDIIIRVIFGVFGLILIATAFTGYCAFYVPFGLDTRTKAQKREEGVIAEGGKE